MLSFTQATVLRKNRNQRWCFHLWEGKFRYHSKSLAVPPVSQPAVCRCICWVEEEVWWQKNLFFRIFWERERSVYVSILGWPACTNLPELHSGSTAWLSAVPHLLLPASLAPAGELGLLWHTTTWSWFLYSSSRNVNSNIMAIPFPLHRHCAHNTQLTLALGMSLTLWVLLMYPPVYLSLTSATDKRAGFPHESPGRGT